MARVVIPCAQSYERVKRALSNLHTKRQRIILLLTSLVPAIALWSVQQGAMPVDVIDVFKHWYSNSLNAEYAMHWLVLTEIRLPRVVLTVITGSMLAVSGAVMQGLCRNPLADPGLIGVSSGAALFAAAALLFGGWWNIPASSLQVVQPLMAFGGALIASVIVFRLARTSTGVNTLLLILAGVAINALAGTLLGLINAVADDDTLRSIVFWTMGSYASVTWLEVIITALVAAPILAFFFSYHQSLTLMLGGDNEARCLGVAVDKVKTLSLIGVALGTALAVCFTGIVGFVGLVVPHICRLILGPDYRYLLPASACLGALLVVIADALARTLVAPAELPVGIITSLIGVPFLLYLLAKQRTRVAHA
ncbi:iron ABC transporter permease [Alteromonas sediminis]|uniref:Iron ABC transporter permease n=1 Tax=Alteromonas sediminis TaxID=2259342 RepID=A0A3N5Y239_9ALTE|nr:iron ABC transporter permease [Alteromonas sediminis]RPJ67013.1 iron ABC transporter permease [Alteromonas sediminis]